MPRPNDEEVTQRAGSLQALTGLTEADFQALLPRFERAFMTHMQDRTVNGPPARGAAIVPLTPFRCLHSQTHGSSF